MKLENKKIVAFMLAIIMSITFVNSGYISAFANDDEPPENVTETTVSEDSEDSENEEALTEEVESEEATVEYIFENEIIGDISSGSIDLIPGGNNSAVSPNAIVPVDPGVTGENLPDGVYSLKNIGNANFWANIFGSNSNAGAQTIQTQSTDNPMDSFNRAFLFKISRVPNTNRYVIRSMLNNRLGLYFDGSLLKTIEIPSVDIDVNPTYTFNITSSGGGYIIKQNATQNVVAAPNSTASGTSNARLIKSTESSAGDRCRWTLFRYTGEAKSGISLNFSPNDWSYGASLNTTYNIELKPWATVIGVNAAYVLLHPDSVDVATTTRINNYKITITPTKVGPISIRSMLYFDGTTTSYIIYRSNYVTVPGFDDENAFIENIGSGKYVDIEGPSINSGAIIQQWDFHGAEQSKWSFDITSGGYFYIKSLYSNLYLGVDSSNTSLVKQYSTQNDYTKWMFTETSSGNYTLKCKAVDNKVLAVPSSNSGNGADLTMVAYTDNDIFYDEWNMYKISNSGAFLLGITDEGHDHSTALGAIMSDISTLGYTDFNCIVTDSIPLAVVQHHMRNSQIYVSRSHGGGGTEENFLELGYLSGGSLSRIYAHNIYDFDTDTVIVDLSNCDLMLFVACDTAVSESRSLPHAAVKAGADCAIGFKISIDCNQANEWTKEFFKQYINEDVDVERAAQLASNKCTGIPYNMVVIVSAND